MSHIYWDKASLKALFCLKRAYLNVGQCCLLIINSTKTQSRYKRSLFIVYLLWSEEWLIFPIFIIFISLTQTCTEGHSTLECVQQVLSSSFWSNTGCPFTQHMSTYLGTSLDPAPHVLHMGESGNKTNKTQLEETCSSLMCYCQWFWIPEKKWVKLNNIP